MFRRFSVFINFLIVFVLIFSNHTFLLADTTDISTPTGILMSDIESVVDTFMEENIGVSTPSASVAIVKDGEIAFSKAYGLSDVENNILATSNTVYEYGSISKLFVWISVMQQVEQGNLDLDVDISTYFSEEFNSKWKTTYPITLRNIMNHSSGFGEYTFNVISTKPVKENQLSTAILNAHPEQYYEPGTASVYSNYGTALAAYAVECVTNMPFYQYETENIFNILKMEDTASHIQFSGNDTISKNKAQGYSVIKSGDENKFINMGWSYIPLYAAGSVNGTADDLAKLIISLMSTSDQKSPLFSDENTLYTMLSPSYEKSFSGTNHGFFDYSSPTSSGTAYGHGGNTLSFSSNVVFLPEEQFGLVVLTNAQNEFDILYGLQDLLIGHKTTKAVEKDKNFPDAKDFSGNYISMRRAENTPMEFASYIMPVKVEAIEDNIKLNIMLFSGVYTQTEPYTFEIIESNHPLLNIIYDKITFKVEDGVPVQILIGDGLDLSTYPKDRQPISLVFSLGIVIISVLFFIVSSIVMLVKFIKRSKINKKMIYKTSSPINILISVGSILSINTLFFTIFLLSNQLVDFMEIAPFIALNYILSFIGIVTILWVGIINKGLKYRKANFLFIMAGLLFILFVYTLFSWNMFALYI